MEYLIILLVFFLVTLFLEFKFHVKLYKNRLERIVIPLIFLFIGTLWDSFAIIRGHWSFQGDGLIGLTIGVMPIEEYLFCLVVPYFIMTSYKVLKKELD